VKGKGRRICNQIDLTSVRSKGLQELIGPETQGGSAGERNYTSEESNFDMKSEVRAEAWGWGGGWGLVGGGGGVLGFWGRLGISLNERGKPGVLARGVGERIMRNWDGNQVGFRKPP